MLLTCIAIIVVYFFSAKPKVDQNAFDDLLSTQGFVGSGAKGPQTLSSMKREDAVKEMDPNSIKVRHFFFTIYR